MKQTKNYRIAALYQLIAEILFIVFIVSIPMMTHFLFGGIGLTILAGTLLALVASYYLFLGARSYFYSLALQELRRDVKEVKSQISFNQQPYLYEEYYFFEKSLSGSYLSNKDFFQQSLIKFMELEERRTRNANEN